MKLLAIGKDDVKMRLDRWLKTQFHRPHSFFQRHLREKHIFLYNVYDQTKHKVDANFKLPEDANVRIGIKESLYKQLVSDMTPVPLPITSSKPKLPVLYSDDDFLIINKPPHLATQLGSNTIDSIATRYPQLKLVHRLDKGTSGILILAKSRRAAAEMAEMFQNHQVHKTYIAQVRWPPFGLPTEGVVNLALDDKPAITHYKVIKRGARTAWLELKPSTGRKHQLRRHCAFTLGAPILGDMKYGQDTAKRMWLHASKISFLHPFTKQDIAITCPLQNMK
ncbi:23S rRNA pseudouridylate synthase [Thraustotheca clavata]|uniref:23S rRNA pseudouridylate synthase n=1 Tax=Thraustotheca clavata TaxID=74557 RepID=A0A1V9ZMA3_9STRA|nr:23S rRNA pseudouridylate synthase [Thraustotheca clavata]